MGLERLLDALVNDVTVFDVYLIATGVANDLVPFADFDIADLEG